MASAVPSKMKLLVKNVQNYAAISRRGIFGLFKRKPNLGVCNIVQPGNVSAERYVPDIIAKPHYYFEASEPGDTTGTPEIKTPDAIEKMRQSCKLAANILKLSGTLVREGISTDEIDAFVHDRIISSGAYPSPLRYAGFPKSVCTSVNNVACHGIPDDRKLMDGDIINIDITVFHNGYHGDCSKTFLVGNVDELGVSLVQSTEECLHGAIELCGPEQPLNLIGKFIDGFARERGLSSMPAFIGHGIGTYFHGAPEIYHFDNNMPGVMKPGNTFTIEPILSLGGQEVEIHEDGWTATSVDNARSAQFEHTVLITDDGVKILTVPD